MDPFIVNNQYNKKAIYETLQVPSNKRRGEWDTGYREYIGNYFIFANIGIPGRTGHDYKNEWIGDLFSWEANSTSRLNQPSIQALIKPKVGQKTYLFTRTNDRAPWTYEGKIKAVNWINVTPVKIIWQFEENPYLFGEIPHYTINSPELLYEGKSYNVMINKYERDPQARRMCIEMYGCFCNACNFNFESQYGNMGKNYIHVHHTVPLSKIGKEYLIDVKKDLVPVCPNCHAMIHASSPILTISELNNIILFPFNYK